MLETCSLTFTDEMTALGFTPGLMFADDEPTFSPDDLKASLFGGDRHFPRTILVNIGEARPVHVVVDTVRSMPVKDTSGEGPIHYDASPDWYVEGEVQGRAQRVRLLCISLDVSSINQVYAQPIQD